MPIPVREIDRFGRNADLDVVNQGNFALGIFVLNAGGIIRYCNEVLLRRIEATLEQSCGHSIRRFIPDFPLDADAPDLGAALAVTAAAPRVARLQSLKGGVAMVRFTVRPLLPLGRSSLVVVIEDIDSKADPMLKRNLAHLMASSGAKSDTIVISDCHGNICFVNTAFEQITGYCRADLIGRNFRDIHFSLPLENQDSDFWKGIQEGNSFSGVCVHPKKDGSHFHHEQRVRPFFSESGAVTHAVFTGRDVSQDVLAMQRLTYQANYDSLTGLPNRNLLSDRLQQVLKRASRCHEGFAVAMLDVDQFKSVNDRHGHAVGDLVLREVGRRVCACIREEDTFGRLGGDEFILIFPGIEKREDAEDVACKITSEFMTGFLIDDRPINISLSIGCAVYPTDGENLQALLDFADSKMYGEKAEVGVDAVMERLAKSLQ